MDNINVRQSREQCSRYHPITLDDEKDRTYKGINAFNIKQARPTVNKATRATK